MELKVRLVLQEARRNRVFFLHNHELVKSLVSPAEWQTMLKIHNLNIQEA
jgi:hypothetical protein